MEENKNMDSQEYTIVQEKPKKKGNAALILGIIGTATGVLALIFIACLFLFRGSGSNMMNNSGFNMMNKSGSNMMNNFRDDRSERIEERGGFGNSGGFCHKR